MVESLCGWDGSHVSHLKNIRFNGGTGEGFVIEFLGSALLNVALHEGIGPRPLSASSSAYFPPVIIFLSGSGLNPTAKAAAFAVSS
jgi:hypothetical protein